MKKAFKTLTKQSWKRRWCQFDPESLAITWHEGEGKKALGEFKIDPLLVLAQPSTDHSNPNEFKVESVGQVFYAYTEAAPERSKLLQRIDAARRVKIAGDDGTNLVKAADTKMTVGSEPGRKVFSWGVGSMLGNNSSTAQAWAVPQVVSTLKHPFSAAYLNAGPEHSACVDGSGDVHIWGSNEFQQAGIAGPAAIYKPVPLSALGARKVLRISCGGSHTLAVVADSADASGGAVVGWGTGTVGQLGLGQSQLLSNEPLVIPMPDIHGHPVPVRLVAAGLVTSAAVLTTGECFVWGDASLGRLGLPDVADSLTPSRLPVCVNGKVIWQPKQLEFTGSDVEKAFDGGKPIVTAICLGGSYSLFLLNSGSGAGGVLLVSGALGIDITKDRYGYPEELAGQTDKLDAILEDDLRGVPRFMTPRCIAPFNHKPVVLAISAGARHAGVVALDSREAPRAYTAGKGWLGHSDDKDTMLLGRPIVATAFAAVGGLLASEDAYEITCGHSHTIVRTSDSRLLAWGRGDSGELGRGNLTDRSMPSPVPQPDKHHWQQTVAGSYYTVAIAEYGSADKMTTNDITSHYESKNEDVASKEKEAIAKLSGGGGDDEEESDPNALPKGWDYEYDADGSIYFIKPNGETTWDDPRT